ncbi:ATP-dependent protease ATPase subunit HslU [Atopobacter phocae]|uniref:ATP-dependent protease ATPase subunit HslU n=1 Tax=Atopobacter phocae TaxID=136492 RepID=UPI00046F4593|nr:ATP-dependent protease ATPase subunit HslU [Atopobacter phocae]
MNRQLGLTPRQIVERLDQYIVGQHDAKRSVAVALRNRYRRMQLTQDMAQEITPKNLLMIGPTGVGKTEIARRLAKLVHAPFIKVEATKFTEVGYVGRDVESMVRDLVENSVQLVKEEEKELVRAEAFNRAVKKLAKIMKPGIMKKKTEQDYMKNLGQLFGGQNSLGNIFQAAQEEADEDVTPEIAQTRKEIEQQLRNGLLDQQEVTIKIERKPQPVVGANPAMEQMESLQETLGQFGPKQKVERAVTVKEALDILTDEAADMLINPEDVNAKAIKRASQEGIIFIDEIDKITSNGEQSGTVSREGVQRDILPIVEGSQVRTKYGVIHTDHILFIGSGAFHVATPSDLIPELQGRFPIRVELTDLTIEDFERILTEPTHALLKQYEAILQTENVTINFTQEAIHRLAEYAFELNSKTENIGARRLHTILEKVLEELLFEAPDMQMGEILITEQYVDQRLSHLVQDEQMNHYIL